MNMNACRRAVRFMIQSTAVHGKRALEPGCGAAGRTPDDVKKLSDITLTNRMRHVVSASVQVFN